MASTHGYLFAAVALAITISRAVAASVQVTITVNDVNTHYAIPALIKAEGPDLFSAYADDAGVLRRDIAPGEYLVEVSAAGYKSMADKVQVGAGHITNFGFMLSPLTPPPEDELRQSKLRAGFTLVSGYVLDNRCHPFKDVRVRLEKAGAETLTDERGFYWLSIPTPPETAVDLPGTDNLIADKRGYRTVIYRNMLVGGEDAGGYVFGMRLGQGTDEHDATHKMMQKGTEAQDPVRGLTKRKN